MERIETYSGDSSDSVKEMEAPEKPPPPIIDLTSDDKGVQKNLKLVEPSNFTDDPFFVSNEEPQLVKGDNPIHWTSDMKKYYNDDWGNEADFIVENMQAEMDKDPSLWEVSPRDLLHKGRHRSRNRAKCYNCCQFGHTAFHCGEEPQVPRCYMCGAAGHIQSSCPSAVCLTCGNQMKEFAMSCQKCIPEIRTFCTRCSLHGHHYIDCSDNWRKFHATTGKLIIDVPHGNVYKSEKDLWCCNCAKKGHNLINCNESRDLTFPDTCPYVSSYATRLVKDIYSPGEQQPVVPISESRIKSWARIRPLKKRRYTEWKFTKNLTSIKLKNRKGKKNIRRSFIHVRRGRAGPK